VRTQCDHYAPNGYRCPYTAIKEFEGEMLCERHYWKAMREQRTPDMCTWESAQRKKCRQPGVLDGLCEVHYESELNALKSFENFLAWLDKLREGELFYGRDAVLPKGVFACLLCGFASYVVDDEVGRKRCTFCGYSWPYGKKERENARSNAGSW
jgi:hypothetical protein